MELPAKDDSQKAVGYRADWPRLAARVSVIGAFLCFTLNCVVNQLLLKNPQPGREGWWLAADGVSMLVLAAGVIAGIIGIIGGVRRKSSDTVGIATIGLVLNCGILFVALWLRSVLRSMH